VDQGARTIVESRKKAGVWLAFGIVGVAVGIGLGLYPPNPLLGFWGWLGAVVFALMLVNAASRLIRPARLTLDAEGFTLISGLRSAAHRVPWDDIDRFLVFTGTHGAQLIGYNYLPGHDPRRRLAKLGGTPGADAQLPTGWSLSDEEVVAALNDYRARYGPLRPAPTQPQIVS
jgi:hypothetical protein